MEQNLPLVRFLIKLKQQKKFNYEDLNGNRIGKFDWDIWERANNTFVVDKNGQRSYSINYLKWLERKESESGTDAGLTKKVWNEDPRYDYTGKLLTECEAARTSGEDGEKNMVSETSGETRSGKSLVTYSIASVIDPTFPICPRKISWRITELGERLSEFTQNACVMKDESVEDSGEGKQYRRQRIQNVIETAGMKKLSALFVGPSRKLDPTGAKNLTKYCFETMFTDVNKDIAKIIIRNPFDDIMGYATIFHPKHIIADTIEKAKVLLAPYFEGKKAFMSGVQVGITNETEDEQIAAFFRILNYIGPLGVSFYQCKKTIAQGERKGETDLDKDTFKSLVKQAFPAIGGYAQDELRRSFRPWFLTNLAMNNLVYPKETEVIELRNRIAELSKEKRDSLFAEQGGGFKRGDFRYLVPRVAQLTGKTINTEKEKIIKKKKGERKP